MESGTLLHIALLRKTSNAKRRQKSLLHALPIKKKSAIQRPQALQQNFTLSGWSTEQTQFKSQLKQIKNRNNMIKLEKLRQSFDQKQKRICTSRSNLKTSQYGQRARNRSQSFRGCVEYHSVNSTKVQNKQRKPINLQLQNHLIEKIKVSQKTQNEQQKSRMMQKQYKLRQIISQPQIKHEKFSKHLKRMYGQNPCVKRLAMAMHQII